jgi:alpha-beta hydrolase superfamily lysophospholipase
MTEGDSWWWRFLDLLVEQSWRNVYAGKLEMRPPGAPSEPDTKDHIIAHSMGGFVVDLPADHLGPEWRNRAYISSRAIATRPSHNEYPVRI